MPETRLCKEVGFNDTRNLLPPSLGSDQTLSLVAGASRMGAGDFSHGVGVPVDGDYQKERMIEVKDPGHRYTLLCLDGYDERELRFVKRCSPPEKYPGNHNAHSGTTLQSVIRCLLERLRYLQGQFWCLENAGCILLLRLSLWLLEFRAGRRHQRLYLRSLSFAETSKMCPQCGHTGCTHHQNT